MLIKTATALLLFSPFLGQTQQVYTPQNVSSNVNGLKVISGHSNSWTPVAHQDAWRQMSLFKGTSFDQQLKAGNVSHLQISQSDLNKIAETTLDGRFPFYASMPLYKKPADQKKVPVITSDVKESDVKCCSLNSSTKATSESSRPAQKFLGKKHARRLAATHRLQASGSSPLVKRAQVADETRFQLPTLPSFDDFYHVSKNIFTSAKSGQPLAYRQVAYNFFYYPAGTRVYQVNYRTETSHGEPAADMTAVLVPAKSDNTHFVSYQMHEDSCSLDCANSWWLSVGMAENMILQFLNNNWVVSVPDFEGVDSLFSAYYRSGISVLNSVRAVQQMADLLSFKNQKALLYGYSSGSAVTGMASDLVQDYAPELVKSIAGMAVGGFCMNLTSTLFKINKGRYSAFIPMSLYALSMEYPSFNKALQADLVEENAWKIPVAASTCAWIIFAFMGQDMFQFEKSREAFVTKPAVAKVMDAQLSGRNAPPFPTFLLQSTADEVADINLVDEAATRFCKGGTRLLYQRDTDGLGHLDQEGRANPAVINFFKKITSGETPSECGKWNDALTILM